MTRRSALALMMCAAAGLVGPPAGGHYLLGAAERVWQTGTWRDVKVDRPRVLFSVQSRDPNSSLPRTAAAREIRTYVIETSTLRLELRQDATVDTPRIDMLVGQPVTFALENKTVYVKDEQGREHKLDVRKRTALSPAEAK